jgi:phenylpropionate dioxygenase-like ring-hydroxylating dioxygenase large terminal subunit
VLYQLDKQVTVAGVVTRFTLGNPHARIYMMVKNEEGADEEWMAEGGSRTVLLRNGWTGKEVRAGDHIKIVGNPSRDGSKIIHWQKLVLPDGTEKWAEDLNPQRLESLRQRRK